MKTIISILITFCLTASLNFAQINNNNKSSFLEPLAWPVQRELNDGVVLMMLVDHNSASGSVNDYMCNDQYVYDGHTGTDITAYNFKEMDWGVPILAANDGQVTYIRDNQFDRNYWPPYVGQPNAVIITEPDGSNTQYWHLRKNSVTVKVGDQVKKGDVIAMMGSSGATPIPHVHFEIHQKINGNTVVSDPFPGSCNSGNGLWEDEYEYPGSIPFRLLDAGIFNKTNLQGSEVNNYFGELYLKDRPTQPWKYGNDEAKLGLWVQSQIQPGTAYKIIIKKPNGEVFTEQNKSTNLKRGIQWHVFYWNFSSQVSSADNGKWVAEIVFNGQLLKTVNFDVGDETIFAPRIYPISGVSIKINGSEQKILLSTEYQNEGLEFSVIDEYSVASLNGNELVISPQSNQEYRTAYFKVVARDINGLSDTARFHVIDYSKPLQSNITEVKNYSALPNEIELYQNYPNPFNPSTKIRFSLPQKGTVQIKIYNQLGQEIRELIDKELSIGNYSITWEGKNEYGQSVSSGIYFATVTTKNESKSIKMLLVK